MTDLSHHTTSKRRTRKPQRIEAMSRLPLFLNLKNRRVVLAGGGEAAAWKAELLCAAGAQIDLYAPEVCHELLSLLDSNPQQGLQSSIIQSSNIQGSISWHQRPWRYDDFDLASLAVCDAQSDAEGHAFYCAAKAVGTPVNVIDRPAFCDLQFGSIVNRDPVLVSITTDGAAPVIGQEIRRRIEAMLPAALGTWAQVAKSIRSKVLEVFPDFSARRAYWQRVTDFIFAAKEGDEQKAEQLLVDTLLEDPAALRRGFVTIVGAGPGAAEHLTLQATRALQSADVILHDDLIEPDVLELARREAKRVPVGKRGGGRPSCKQTDINRMMVEMASQGQRVVRLKSGDPMIFGRAGEEIDELDRSDIAFEVVPGVTAAFGAAARLGVSLTHRDLAQSVRFITGHGKSGTLPETLDWRGLADPHTTLIIYMGGRTAGRLAARLIEAGLAPDTPVALIEAATKPSERRLSTTLKALNFEDLAPDGPLLIGVGRVFGLRRETWSQTGLVEPSAFSSAPHNAFAPAPATQGVEPHARDA